MTNLPEKGKVADYKESFRDKFWMKLLGSPLVLAPLLIGCSSLMANWALELHNGIAAFAGVAALLVSTGVFCTRLFTSGSDIGKEVAADMAVELEQRQHSELDQLEKALEADGDPRTESALQDLRKLSAAFSRESLWPDDINSASRRDIMENVARLFNSCVELLRKSLELWNVASEIKIAAARKPIMQRRENMLLDVSDGLKQLGGVLAGLHEISVAHNDGDDQVRRLSEQLEESMRVAKAAERRIAGIEREIEERSSI